jgi:hypothetical protein
MLVAPSSRSIVNGFGSISAEIASPILRGVHGRPPSSIDAGLVKRWPPASSSSRSMSSTVRQLSERREAVDAYRHPMPGRVVHECRALAGRGDNPAHGVVDRSVGHGHVVRVPGVAV